MRKNKEQKKGSENTIGKIIYGFLLFMPLIAIGVTCGYAMFNKNAYKSNSYGNSYKTYRLENNGYTEPDKQYTFTYQNNNQDNTSVYTYSDININWTDYGFSGNYEYDGFQLRWISNQYSIIYLYAGNTTTWVEYKNSVWGTSLTDFTITSTNSVQTVAGNFYITSLLFTSNTLDNVFYYSVDKVTESPLFNWAQNSIIYTTTNATCNALSITAPFIPLLLSYWLIISVIYFLYDIILILIWAVHDKIHDLKESIS